MEKVEDSVGPVVVISLTWYQDVLCSFLSAPMRGPPHSDWPSQKCSSNAASGQAPLPALWPALTLGKCTGQLFLRNSNAYELIPEIPWFLLRS